jgi:hypothetical protein
MQRFSRGFLIFLLATTTIPAVGRVSSAASLDPLPDQVMQEDGRHRVAVTFNHTGSLTDVGATSSNRELLPPSGITIRGQEEPSPGTSRVTTLTLILTPAADRSGSTRVTVRARQGSQDLKESFALTVLPVNDAPSFAAPPARQAITGRTYRSRLVASDPDAGDTATLTVLEKPDWLRIRPAGRRRWSLRGLPGTADLGRQRLRVQLSDAAGAIHTRTFVINVLEPRTGTPVLDPPGGTFSGAIQVSLGSPTAGASIRYTTDGTLPTSSGGTLYENPIPLASSATLTARAFHDGMRDSAVAVGTFLFTPVVTTGGLDQLAADAATLTGTGTPRGSALTAWFEWGSDPGLSDPRQTATVDLGAGDDPVPFTGNLAGLDPGTTYYYRAVVSGAAGTATGAVEYFTTHSSDNSALLVNSLEDTADPPLGKMTLRAALELLDSEGTISFDPSLAGGTIPLSLVGATDTILLGEVFTMSAGRWVFQGYQERNYGPSSLYVQKNLTIDASALPGGITLRWTGGDSLPARVLAVWGDLTMKNVTILSGRAVSVPLPDNPSQPHTLARGGGLAVWGTAQLDGCALADNTIRGDIFGSRDRGAFGGGIYANRVILQGCVVSGNAAKGYGAAGGGIYSVGGADGLSLGSEIYATAVTGNRVSGQHAYGGGIYSDGGGPGNLFPMDIAESTVARNLVEDNPDIAESNMTQYYYRGGGIYMSNGMLRLRAVTVAENRVTGVPHVFGGKPNMGGGGIAATVGNAHMVESMEVWHSVLVGNLLQDLPNDLFTGSLIDFYSYGHNLVGVLDWSGILAPIPNWLCLSRRHWPKVGDGDGYTMPDLLDAGGAVRHPDIVSRGTDAGEKALLWYPPSGAALDAIPGEDYSVPYVWADYTLLEETPHGPFLNLVLEKLRRDHGDLLGEDFGARFGDLSAVEFYAEPVTWPSDSRNAPWISFWKDLETALDGRLGNAGLTDDFWGSFESGPLDSFCEMTVLRMEAGPISRGEFDQRGAGRFHDGRGDAGAIEHAGP